MGLFSGETHEVSGTVERVGPYISDTGVVGVVLLLSEDKSSYRLLNGSPSISSAHIVAVGLTCAGDDVVMQVDKDGVVATSSFRNLTLEARLAN